MIILHQITHQIGDFFADLQRDNLFYQEIAAAK